MASMVVVLMDDPRADCMFPGLEGGESGEGWGVGEEVGGGRKSGVRRFRIWGLRGKGGGVKRSGVGRKKGVGRR